MYGDRFRELTGLFVAIETAKNNSQSQGKNTFVRRKVTTHVNVIGSVVVPVQNRMSTGRGNT